jgi:polar amino acid transport system substrate-binding protein
MIGAKAENVNYFVIGSTAAPFQIEEDGKKHRGIITDILQRMSPKNFKYKTITLPFKRYSKALENSRDYWVTYGSDVWDGPQSWNNSKEYLFEVKHVFFSLKDKKITKIEDLFNKRIILITGFAYPELEKYLKTGRIKALRVNDHEAAIAAVEKGRGIAFPEMDLRLRYHLRLQQKNAQKYQYSVIPGILKPYKIFMAYSRNFPESLKQDFDSKIKEYRSNGTMGKIIMKYVDYNYQVF